MQGHKAPLCLYCYIHLFQESWSGQLDYRDSVIFEPSNYALGGFMVVDKLYPLSFHQLAIKLFSPSINLLPPIFAKGKTVKKALSVLSPFLGVATLLSLSRTLGEHGLNKKQV